MGEAFSQYWPLIKHLTLTFCVSKPLGRSDLTISGDVFPWAQFLKSKEKHGKNISIQICTSASQIIQKGLLNSVMNRHLINLIDGQLCYKKLLNQIFAACLSIQRVLSEEKKNPHFGSHSCYIIQIMTMEFGLTFKTIKTDSEKLKQNLG